MEKRLILSSVVCLLVALLAFPKAASAQANYASSILADSPDIYWRLNEGNGATSFTDATGNGNTGSSSGYLTQGPGAILGDSSTALGMWFASNTVFSPQRYTSSTYTAETWFQANGNSGGGLLGFRESGVYGRNVWLDNAGHVVAQIADGSTTNNLYVTSTKVYNDNLWHMVALTVTPTLMTLYVDGQSVGSTAISNIVVENVKFYVGPADLSSFSNKPSSKYTGGLMDETALWSTRALTAADIQRHYALGMGGLAPTTIGVAVDPSFSFTVAGSSVACNSISPSGGATSTSTAINLGRVTAATNAIANQTLSVSSNAAAGFSVVLKSSGALQSSARALTQVSGTFASPSAFPSIGTEGFGINTSGLGANWAAAPTSSQTLWTNAGPGQALTSCLSYRVGVSPTTPAGTYSGSSTYTAIPSF